MENKLTVPEAAAKAEVTNQTIYNWIEDFDIGKKIAGRWIIFEDKLNMILNGELTYDNQGRPPKKDKKKNS